MKVPLSRLAHARSGDKGDTANIGVIAREDRYYPILAREVTADRVKRHFGSLCRGEVEHFELPNLAALNFLLPSQRMSEPGWQSTATLAPASGHRMPNRTDSTKTVFKIAGPKGPNGPPTNVPVVEEKSLIPWIDPNDKPAALASNSPFLRASSIRSGMARWRACSRVASVAAIVMK